MIKSFDGLSQSQLESKITTAQTCFETWRHTSYADRAKIIAKAGELRHKDADKFARIMAYYAKNAEQFLAPVKLNPTHGEAHMESSTISVIFCVEPWNFPYYQLARVAGPHLMAGNTMVVKHAGIKSVALTGSVAAGRSVASRAGQQLKASSMELGGSNAFIVVDDAGLEHTVLWAIWGRMYNTGKTCCAAKRFIVVESMADIKPENPAFRDEFFGPVAIATAQRLGDVGRL